MRRSSTSSRVNPRRLATPATMIRVMRRNSGDAGTSRRTSPVAKLFPSNYGSWWRRRRWFHGGSLGGSLSCRPPEHGNWRKSSCGDSPSCSLLSPAHCCSLTAATASGTVSNSGPLDRRRSRPGSRGPRRSRRPTPTAAGRPGVRLERPRTTGSATPSRWPTSPPPPRPTSTRRPRVSNGPIVVDFAPPTLRCVRRLRVAPGHCPGRHGPEHHQPPGAVLRERPQRAVPGRGRPGPARLT